MRAAVLLLALSSAAWAQSDRDEELVLALGGKIRELKAVLVLTPEQEKNLIDLFVALKKEADDFRVKIREKGADAVRADYERWQEEARAKFRKTLTGTDQARKYDAYLARKNRLAAEFDKALFGIPPVTEMKLRLQLDEAAVEPMAKAADAAVEKIRKTVADLKKNGAKQEDLAKAVNDARKSGIEKMIEAAPAKEQAKVKQYVKDYLRPPQDKLARSDRDRLERTLKGLDLKDPDKERSSRRIVAAILMHKAENEALRKAMGKELLVLILTKKNEGEMWSRMNEYRALIDIHDRRLKDLYGDSKSLFTSQEIAKLVSDGLIE